MVVAEKAKDEGYGVVSFLSSAGFSPTGRPSTKVNPDGSFCSERLGPGKYYLYFTGSSDGRLTSSVFYPGVSARSEATAVEIRAGKNQTHVIFKVPAQKAYTVRGLISINDKSELAADMVRIELINFDVPGRAWYFREVNFQGAFPLPKVKYFTFDDVLPGQYVAHICYRVGSDWFTKKVDVSVTTHMKFIFLDLVHGK
jgi:hypothetical protein